MSFNTKIDLSDSKSYQATGQTLTLSGETKIATGTGLKYVTHPTFTGNTQIVDKKYVDDSIITATGSTLYTLESPAAVAVGGITVGWVLTGKTSNCILQDILVPELFGTVSEPNNTIALSPTTTTYEVGCSISTIFTGSFTRGSINPAYCTDAVYSTLPTNRSGLPNNYCFTGSQISGLYPSTALSKAKSLTGYTVTLGAQTWGVCVYYGGGNQPKGSKGTNTPTYLPLAAGNTANAPATITGILPWYWGVSASGTITNAIITGGTKTVGSVAASTPITFNAVAQFLWFAAPAGTYTTKTKWWVCAANAGNIGGTGELWKQQGTLPVTSGQGCWAGQTYDVYVTCGITTTAVGISMCLY
jgi:hypothetical protein